jgi:hypothetical protein
MSTLIRHCLIAGNLPAGLRLDHQVRHAATMVYEDAQRRLHSCAPGTYVFYLVDEQGRGLSRDDLNAVLAAMHSYVDPLNEEDEQVAIRIDSAPSATHPLWNQASTLRGGRRYFSLQEGQPPSPSRLRTWGLLLTGLVQRRRISGAEFFDLVYAGFSQDVLLRIAFHLY